jgi:ATP-binding cassette, subfamily B, bacterial
MAQAPAAAAAWRRLYAEYWRYSAGARSRIALSNALLVASQLVKLGVPWLAAQAINAVQLAGGAGLASAAAWAAAIVGTCALCWALHGPGRVIERGVGVQVRRNVSDALYGRVTALPLAWHQRHHSGESVLRIRQTSAALADFAQNQFLYLQNFVNLAGPVIALALIALPLGATAFAGFALIGWVIVRFDRAMMPLLAAETAAERRYAATLADHLGNITTLVSLRLQAAARSALARRLGEVFAPLRRVIVLTEWKWCAVDLLSVALAWTLVAVYVLWGRDANAPLLIGNVYMVYQYAQQAGGVIVALAAHYQQFARIQVDFAAADEILAAAPRPAPPPIPADWRTIDVAGVSVRYSRRQDDRAALVDATVQLTRGRRIALVGPSGAGKSALLRVLAGLFDAAGGRFAIDGVVRADLHHLGAIATLIPQDPQIFAGSLRDNLDLAGEHSPARRARAVEACALERLIAELPGGLESELDERGANLSGGQRQRIALARGLLAAASSSLVLIDEPTSSLDPLTEARLVPKLLASFPDACVVTCVHRLELLAHFDEVVLLEHGRVLAQGTPAELLASQPLLRALIERDAAARLEAVA